MPQKASTPWSTRTVAEGGTDSPVGDLVPVPDEIKPVVNTGFIATTGKFTGIPSDDLAFTLSNKDEAIAAGASMFIDPVNMLNHNFLIIALLDSSGNDINVDLDYKLNGAAASGPYANPIFTDVGISGNDWVSNDPGDGSGVLVPLLQDTNTDLFNTWRFFKIGYLKGTSGLIRVRSNEGADAGNLSGAFLRIV